MTERTKRRRFRKQIIDERLVELFRKAIPAYQAHWRAIVTGKEMSMERLQEAARRCNAFDIAAGVKPWEHSPLKADATDKALQEALLAKLTPAELKQWRAFARRWEMAEIERQDRSAKT
jgi:hypothetical protein